MPLDLKQAHELNDKAVMMAYGLDKKMTESEWIAKLIKMYQEMVIKSSKN